MAFNFDFLGRYELFASFAQMASDAEKIYVHNPTYCAVGCRMALETSLRWLYSVEKSLRKPYETHLAQLLTTDCFHDFLPYPGMWAGLDFVRRLGNTAAHGNAQISASRAKIALRNLYVFFDFLASRYCENYSRKAFDASLLGSTGTQEKPEMRLSRTTVPAQEVFDAENADIREKLSALGRSRAEKYVEPRFDSVTEAETRRQYIDVMLEDAGWTRGKDWRDEYPLDGLVSSPSGKGAADYVLFDDGGFPLAVVEAKKASQGVEVGRIQAREYADALERKFGRRPLIFLTNGFETHIWADREAPERAVSGIYSKNDLEWTFQKMRSRRELDSVPADKKIAGRDYQLNAVKSVCEAFGVRKRRKALLVMATGSGKTRVAAALADVLVRANWVRHALFLADRTELVRQAKSGFAQHLPTLTTANLSDGSADALNARVVFSTYQTMINAVDAARGGNGERLFSCGHFDVIIIDEAHRSIYNKYKDIFRYFDARIIGLTATPRNEIERSTYGEFELEDNVPTFAYELAQAVRDGFLVSFKTVETTTRFLEDGICYDELSSEEKATFEDTFDSTEDVDSDALNTWVFNRDTIREVLHLLVKHGLHVDCGNKLGKTIIFAKNHRHAEEILSVWNADFSEFPPGFCAVIDNRIKHAELLIDAFKKPAAFPQIAVSVDMLDTGIDVPEVLNLVFFKKVRSRSKFWQMIGRGTRLCPGLIDGKDKAHFLIFDLCGNFEFFKVNKEGVPAKTVRTLAERLFCAKLELCHALQDLSYAKNAEAGRFREKTKEELRAQVANLDRKNFAVKLNLRSVEKFSESQTYVTLDDFKQAEAEDKVAPLLPQIPGDVFAAGFDVFMHRLELAEISGNSENSARMRKELQRRARALSRVGASVPEIREQETIISKIAEDARFLEHASFPRLEETRQALRPLMKYLAEMGTGNVPVYTDFDDQLGAMTVNESPVLYDAGDLTNYHAKLGRLVRENQDLFAIRKLRLNQPLTENDLRQLEGVLWKDEELREGYRANEGEKPLGFFVREILGMDAAAARAAFSDFLNGAKLTSAQRYFVEMLVGYIIKNGVVQDWSIFQRAPFDERGAIGDVFADNMALWEKVRSRVEAVNAAARG